MTKLYVNVMKKVNDNYVILKAFDVESDKLSLLNQTKRYHLDGVMYDVEEICVSFGEQPTYVYLK